MLNVEDTHLVTYAIRKLERAGLVSTGKSGKEKTVAITDEGVALCEQYREVREAILMKSMSSLGLDGKALSAFARDLRMLSGHYDQATRAAASL